MTIADIILELFRQRRTHQRAACSAHKINDENSYQKHLGAAQSIADAILILSRKP